MKEIYEMTKEEYLNNFYNTLSDHKKEVWKEQMERPQNWSWTMTIVEKAKHKVAIRNAIWIGKIVSDEVLKDYPDLVEQFKKEIEENKLGFINIQ